MAVITSRSERGVAGSSSGGGATCGSPTRLRRVGPPAPRLPGGPDAPRRAPRPVLPCPPSPLWAAATSSPGGRIETVSPTVVSPAPPRGPSDIVLLMPVGPDRRVVGGRGGGMDPVCPRCRVRLPSGWERDRLCLVSFGSIGSGSACAWPSRSPSLRPSLGRTPPGWDRDLASSVLPLPCAGPAASGGGAGSCGKGGTPACRLGTRGRESRPRWSAACRGSMAIAPGLMWMWRFAGVRDRGPLGAGVCVRPTLAEEVFTCCGPARSLRCASLRDASSPACGVQGSCPLAVPAISACSAPVPARGPPDGAPPRGSWPSGRVWSLAHSWQSPSAVRPCMGRQHVRRQFTQASVASVPHQKHAPLCS